MRAALKLTEEALTMISDLTGAPTDVFGEENYMLFTIHSLEPFEITVKLMTEDQIFEEVKKDSSIDIHAL